MQCLRAEKYAVLGKICCVYQPALINKFFEKCNETILRSHVEKLLGLISSIYNHAGLQKKFFNILTHAMLLGRERVYLSMDRWTYKLVIIRN